MNFDQSILPTRSVKPRKKNLLKGKRKNEDSSLKVVYISSPMKVKTSASRFRSLVQELTGKHSDISQYMDDNNYETRIGSEFHHEIDCGEELIDNCDNRKLLLSSSVSPDVDTPTSSEYSLCGGPVDDSLFISQMNEEFGGVFSSDSFYDPSRMDVLGSFDDFFV